MLEVAWAVAKVLAGARALPAAVQYTERGSECVANRPAVVSDQHRRARPLEGVLVRAETPSEGGNQLMTGRFGILAMYSRNYKPHHGGMYDQSTSKIG